MKTNLKEVNELHNKDLYLYFYEDFIDYDRTRKECEFIIKECSLKPDSTILDLACGHGRHALGLAEKNRKVTAIDMNHGFITLARKNRETLGLDVDFRLDNILNIDFQERFDGIILLFNSFGFLDKNDAITLIQKMKSALRKNGKIIIDIKNRDTILKEMKSCHLTEKNQDLMIDRLSFDPINGTTKNERIYIKDGIRYDTPFTMQMYNYTEFNELINKNGLFISKLYGDWQRSPFNQNSRRIIAIIEKQ